MTLTTIEEEILILLRTQPLYGGQIKKFINEAYDYQRDLNDGSLYPTLKRMEVRGLVTSEWNDGVKYYSITPEGEEALEYRERTRMNLLEGIE
jgi:PadR family transcriptional regulator, regulatory protein PadR